MGRSARAWIGVSGYDYPHWGRGAFYPPDLPRRGWLSYAAGFFNSVELNGTFYSLKSPDVFRRWVERTPDRGFVFAVKSSRYITHNLKLRHAEQALANFFASGILLLGRRTGPFLWQLPDSYAFDPARIEGFLDLLPCSSGQAEALARGHDQRLKRGAADTGTRSRCATRRTSTRSSTTCCAGAASPSSSRRPPASGATPRR
jgi:uncharacterized protein YecE (DUF72 family)